MEENWGWSRILRDGGSIEQYRVWDKIVLLDHWYIAGQVGIYMRTVPETMWHSLFS